MLCDVKVSIYWLSEATGKHPATIKKRISALERDKDGKVNSNEALECIYIGGSGTTEEVIKQLNIKRTQEIDLEMEIKRGIRVPIADCLEADNECFQTIAGTIKANRNKVLNETLTNELFETLRDWAGRLNGNGSH